METIEFEIEKFIPEFDEKGLRCHISYNNLPFDKEEVSKELVRIINENCSFLKVKSCSFRYYY